MKISLPAFLIQLFALFFAMSFQVHAGCSCSPGPMGTNIGMEYVACGVDVADDQVVTYTVHNNILCVGSSFYKPGYYWKYTQSGTPSGIADYLANNGNFRVFKTGSHILAIDKYFKGEINGVKVTDYPFGMVHNNVITGCPYIYPPDGEENNDSDNDGIVDCIDHCPNQSGSDPDQCGCPSFPDTDSDGIPDKDDLDNQNTDKKELGQGQCPKDNFVANPINIFNGNNFEQETDLVFPSPFSKGLSFRRAYNSRSDQDSPLGFGWTHNFNIVLHPNFSGSDQLIEIIDSSGRGIYFDDNDQDGIFKGAFLETDTIEKDTNDNYLWTKRDGDVYKFDGTTGRLLSMTDKNGNIQVLTYTPNDLLSSVTDQASDRTLTFNYNANNLISSISGPVTDAVPDGIWVSYTYGTNNNLTRVAYADDENGSAVSGFEYHYHDSNDPNNMTAKYNLSGTLLSSWTYTAQDRADSNTNTQGTGVTITYTGDTQVSVTDIYGITTIYSVSEVAGRKKIIQKDHSNGCNSCSSGIYKTDYNTDGDPVQREYFNGRIVQYQDYDADHNPGTIITNPGTSDEKIVTKTYHPSLSTPLSITEKSLLADTGNPGRNKVIIFDYDDPSDEFDTDTPNENPGNLIHRRIERGYTRDASGSVVAYEYITTMTYNSKGCLTGLNGPLPGSNDTAAYDYNPVTGDLLSVTIPVTGTVTFEYDNAGNITRLIDQNGIETLISYDGRNRRLTTTIDGKTSNRTYTAAGDTAGITDRAGVTINYAYNPEGFLARITRPTGEYMYFAYNARGKVIEASTHTADGTRTQYKGYDYGEPANNTDLTPGSPWKILRRNASDTADLETTYGYTHGRVTRIIDPKGAWKAYTYDTMDRLTRTEELQTGIQTVVTQYEYDPQNNLTKVIDANNTQTTFTYDDAGRLIKQASPDTGTTTYAYNEAGLLMSKIVNSTDPIEYTYDEQGRLTAIIYSDSSRDIIYTYDQGIHGRGRLTGIQDPSGTYAYTYNSLGYLVSEEKVLSGTTYTTGYTYDNTGNLLSVTYPSGRTINYNRDTSARITGVTTLINSTTQTLAQNIIHTPFGPVQSLEYGNNKALTKTFDLSLLHRALSVQQVFDTTYTRDNAGNIIQIRDTLEAADQSFTYNDLYQLTGAADNAHNLDYGYDPVGNRESAIINGQTATYTYSPGTNKLLQIDGPAHPVETLTLEYSLNERLKKISRDQTVLGEYEYNSQGQRTGKTVNSNTTIYHYDIFGNLIAESDLNGTISKEYVYLDGRPLAMLTQNQVYYYHNDHLGAPKALTDQSGTIVWQADYTPFGKAEITINTIENNLRFPGQYFDGETGLHYNWHRYYDPDTGRYLTPDPIGLAGGINPFIYVLNDPIHFMDPYGLVRWKEAGKATLGLIGNGLGMVVGGGLILAPDVTMLTKVASGAVAAKSSIGWGLNWYNLTQSLTQDCEDYDAPSSAARAIAKVTAPGNNDALLAADAIDLSIDFATGRMIFRYPYGAPTIEGVNGIKRAFDPISKTFTHSNQIKAFQAFEVGRTVYGDLWQE